MAGYAMISEAALCDSRSSTALYAIGLALNGLGFVAFDLVG
jgi:hypothetical protein